MITTNKERETAMNARAPPRISAVLFLLIHNFVSQHFIGGFYYVTQVSQKQKREEKQEYE